MKDLILKTLSAWTRITYDLMKKVFTILHIDFQLFQFFKISEVTPLKISRTGVRVPKLNDAIEWFSFER